MRNALLEEFANTHSLSLQQTLYAMGKGALEAVPEIAEIRLSLPNKHHFLVDLGKWDLDNPNQVFYAADRPYGLIEAADHPGRCARCSGCVGRHCGIHLRRGHRR